MTHRRKWWYSVTLAVGLAGAATWACGGSTGGAHALTDSGSAGEGSSDAGAESQGTPDGGSDALLDGGAAQEGGDEQGTGPCTILTGNPACDTCLEGACCSQVTACDQGSVGDGGRTECQQIMACTEGCIQAEREAGPPEAGSSLKCESNCASGHSAAAKSAASAVSSCLVFQCPPCQ